VAFVMGLALIFGEGARTGVGRLQANNATTVICC